MNSDARVWLKLAGMNVKATETLFAANLHASCVFHCQQAVEFALKGLWVLKRDNDIPKVHSLVVLGQSLEVPKAFVPFFESLTQAYIDSRYPDASTEEPEDIYEETEAREILRNTLEFMQWIQSELNKK